MFKKHGFKIYLLLIIIAIAALGVFFLVIPTDFNFVIKVIVLAVILLLVIFLAISAISWITKKIYWYEQLFDSIPFPISVTDMDMRWTFINKPVEKFLGIKRGDVLGNHCSNWDAKICNTDDCGIECLRRGEGRTFFNQQNMDFQVDIHYIHDAKGKAIGHIEVVQDISETVKTLNEQARLINEIEVASRAFVQASQTISEESQKLALGSNKQTHTIEDLSNSIRNFSLQTQENAGTISQAVSLAGEIIQKAELGSLQMSRMTQAVEDIEQASRSISNVIKIIDDIAFQTNILALNAAVEAARAGSHGKGFAVVADEVRTLASKSAESAKNTADLIDTSIKKAEIGVNISLETANSLSQIISSINESVTLLNSIGSASEIQNETITSINSGIDEFEKIVQQNSNTAENNAATAEEMNSQSYVLHSLIEDFTSKGK